MVNSGTEATMSAIRLARGYTGRRKIIKFIGCYHGHVDSLLVAAGSGALTFGEPDSAGVPREMTQLTITVPYNDREAVKKPLNSMGATSPPSSWSPSRPTQGFTSRRTIFSIFCGKSRSGTIPCSSLTKS